MRVYRSRSDRVVPRARSIMPAILMVVALFVTGRHVPATSAQTPPAITFTRPVTISIGQEGFEPDLQVNSRDELFSSVPNGFATTVSFMWRSFEHGQSWKLVPNSTGDGTGKLQTCPGGGDTEIAIDQNNRLYYNDLQGLTNFSTSRSEDDGVTFYPPLAGCAGTPTNTLVDRQWYAIDGDPYHGDVALPHGHVFLAYDQVAQGADPSCPAGNNELVLTESPPPAFPSPSTVAGIEFGPQNRVSCHEGIMGNDAVSPRNDPVYHQRYVFDVHDNDTFDAIRMARCSQVPLSVDPSGLSCTDFLVCSGVRTAHPCDPNPVIGESDVNVGQNFATMAIDSAGNLYAVWAQTPLNAVEGAGIGPTSIELSYSTNNGVTWSTPRRISQACTGTICYGMQTNTNVYPWVTAGDAGRIDVVWYGTSTLKNPSGVYGADALTDADWNVFLAQSLAADSSSGIFAVRKVSEKPIHYGSIQTLPNQSGDRTSGDFLNVRTGLDGEANITYVDSANDTDLGQSFFVRQNGGPSLYASKGTVTGQYPTQTNGIVDGSPCTIDNGDDASYDGDGMMHTQCGTNLDLVSSKIGVDPNNNAYLKITIQPSNLTGLAPPPNSGPPGTTVVEWLVAWHQPCAHGTTTGGVTCTTDGHVWHAYMESVNGGAPRFFDGRSSYVGSAYTTYPGLKQIPTSSSTGICQSSSSVNCYIPGKPGTIVIDVPRSDVGSPASNSTLYSVTTSALTLSAPGNSNNAQCQPPLNQTSQCGVLFNVVDSIPPYDASVAPRP